MLRLLSYLLMQKTATMTELCPSLPTTARGLPIITQDACSGASKCNACVEICPTKAITVLDEKNSAGSAKVALDLGACIGCSLCYRTCPTGTISETLSTRNARKRREDLILNNEGLQQQARTQNTASTSPFDRSLYARVVSTGCAACDLEIGASGNPIFDIERFGVHIVASPRYADALMVTGPVCKSMQPALLSCYEAMSEPRAVVAVGTCAISGGVHKGGYAEANGLEGILPVDVYIPGCPPEPWQIIFGVLLAMGKENICPPEKETIRKHNN
ncbi:MAG: NADH-quinone oxidoreductase subunit NuoB [Candidatus Obscuribacterales bacterium]|nr:NADH-quinone oxidoreductase subunit NuoB [Candidatus Obscuribacterales bacterium]